MAMILKPIIFMFHVEQLTNNYFLKKL